MNFDNKQKKELIKMMNNRFLNNIDKIECYKNHHFLNDQFVLKYSDDEYDIDIILHIHSSFHKDMEIDVHDKKKRLSLIFDTHQYFINPKDIKRFINFILDSIENDVIKITEKDVIDVNSILGLKDNK